MAHSWVQMFDSEYDAFVSYCRTYPHAATLLVDTYNTLKSGVPNAIRAFKEVLLPQGITKCGIRLDSGDLTYLSKKAREMLDEAGLTQCTICASNSLDEYIIRDLLHQGAALDVFGVGERMITARSEPVFGAVYKLCAVEENGVFQPRIKISETVAKITNPGLKQVYRVYNADGKAVADLLTGPEGIDEDAVRTGYRFIDPERPWKKREFKGCTAKKLQKQVMAHGRRTEPATTVREIAAYVRRQLAEEIWDEEQRFQNPHKHYIDMSPEYYAMKMSMLEENHG